MKNRIHWRNQNPKALVLVAALAMGTSFAARAEEPELANESRAKIPTSNKAADLNAADEIITNNNLRALSGSTSRWSFASQWNYNGGTIYSPFDESRPNIAAASVTTPKTDVNGALNIKRNIDSQSSVFLGFGVRWVAPFTAGGPKNYSGTTYDAVNPTATYQRLYRAGGVQALLQAQVLQYTQADAVASGYGQQFLLVQENIYEVGTTGISIGGSVGTSRNLFSKQGEDLDSVQSVTQAWFSPYIEYKINDRINLRTVSNLWVYEWYRDGSLVRNTVTQSVGVGFSVTRDLFLYPNVQFLPDAIASNRTNVGLGATINLF